MKRILGPVKKKKTSPDISRPQSTGSQDTDISEPQSLNFQWKEAGDGKKEDGVGRKDSSSKDDFPNDTSPVHKEEHVNGLKNDSG